MAHNRIALPIDAYIQAQDIARRVHEREIDSDQAAFELSELIAPYCAHLPGPDDTTEIVLQVKQRVFLTQQGPLAYPPVARRRKPPAN
jgi:hypothetical protein